MVCPELKGLISPDVRNLDTDGPQDPYCFGILVQALIGPRGSEGKESFDIIVCTPRWLEREVASKQTIIGLHHLIVNEYDIRVIRNFVTKFVEHCRAATWDEAAQKLSCLGHWEFEEYTDARGPGERK